MEKKTITAQEFASKFRSKEECYRFLAYEAEIFLPPYQNVTGKPQPAQCIISL